MAHEIDSNTGKLASDYVHMFIAYRLVQDENWFNWHFLEGENYGCEGPGNKTQENVKDRGLVGKKAGY